MRAGFQEDALSYLLVLRLIPLFPFWLVNLVPAFLGVSLKVFALGTLIGIIPGSLVYASVGNGLGAIFAAGQTDSIKHAIYKPEVLLPIAGLIRSEEHTSELQSLMRISYAVFCLKKKNKKYTNNDTSNSNNKITKIRKHLAKPNTKSTT